MRNAKALNTDAFNMTFFDSCDCKSHFLMSPKSDMLTLNMSECTKFAVHNFLSSYASNCLEKGYIQDNINNNPVSKGSVESICGNGIIDSEEECDCGNFCAFDSCCSTDCKLLPGAQCSDYNSPCCRNCRIVPKSENFKCSISVDPCIESTVCDGEGPECPDAQNFLSDGSFCLLTQSNSNFFDWPNYLTCSSGICTSRDLQCKILARRFKSSKHCNHNASDDQECRMQCFSEIYGCVKMADFFLDGTECSKGMCYNGKCITMPFYKISSIVFRIFLSPVSWLLFILIVLLILSILIIMRVVSFARKSKIN